MSRHPIPLAVWISIRLFRLLLLAYPAGFRWDYAPEMERAFAAQCREVHRRLGPVGVLCLWPATLSDWLASALGEHVTGRATAAEAALAASSGQGVRLGAGRTLSSAGVPAGALLAFALLLYGFARYPSGLTGDTPAGLLLVGLELAL